MIQIAFVAGDRDFRTPEYWRLALVRTDSLHASNLPPVPAPSIINDSCRQPRSTCPHESSESPASP
jgi:hypothetical protein